MKSEKEIKRRVRPEERIEGEKHTDRKTKMMMKLNDEEDENEKEEENKLN